MKIQRKKRWIRERKTEKGRKGFTLVELIVVLALIAIMAAASVAGLINYTAYAAYKRNSENARTIFNAAQAAVSYYKASGRLDDLRREVETLSQSPAFVPTAAFAEEQKALADAGESAGRRNDTISYLRISRTCYKTIRDAVKGNAGDPVSTGDKEADLLFELLRNYVTDVSIYNASICVEFDAADGVVSGVLYCDRADSFYYGKSSGSMDIAERGESYRRDVGLGYYSTVLSERAPQKIGDLQITKVRLRNAETLDVQWFLQREYQYLKSERGYTVEIYEQGDTRPLMRIVLGQSEIEQLSTEGGGRAYLTSNDVTLYGYREDAAGNVETKEYKPADSPDSEGVRFHAYLAQDAEETENYGSGIALSLDVTDSYLAEAAAIEEPAAQRAAVGSTYSARRFSYTDADGVHYGLNLDAAKPILARVMIESDMDSAKDSNYENLLFAGGSVKEDGPDPADREYHYEIANARHLYNVRFREQDGANGVYPARSIVYGVINDFAWGGPQGLLAYTDKNPEGGKSGLADAPAGITTKYFHRMLPYELAQAEEGETVKYPALPSIVTLGETSVLKSMRSEYAQEGFAGETGGAETPDGADGGTAGVPGGGTEPVYTIDYLALEPEKTGEDGGVLEGVGLVQTNKGVIENLRLSHVDVRGIVRRQNASEGESAGTPASGSGAYVYANKVGAFCGENDGVLKGVETVSGYVTGGTDVGGIAGAYTENAVAAPEGGAPAGLKNGAEVSGLKNVGGIIGAAKDMILEQDENRGIVYGYALPADGGPQTDPVYIGGIVGYAAGGTAIRNCISVPQPQADRMGSVTALTPQEIRSRMSGNYVGGIAGFLEDAACVENCGTLTADGNSQSYVLGTNFVGGIVGYNAGSGSITAGSGAQADGGSAQGVHRSNAAQVIGSRFVGGITGANGELNVTREKMETEPEQITHNDFKDASASTISGWTNTGLVAAIGAAGEEMDGQKAAQDGSDAGTGQAEAAYVGGIVGANAAGTIENCVVNQAPEVRTMLEELGGTTADYAGGIAGYNGGNILSENVQVITSQMAGRNFVGGVVGYNDGARAGRISGYAVSNISVKGGEFVGGFVGLNTAASLLEGENGAPKGLAWNADAIEGGSYVGGYAGANIVAAKSLSLMVEAGTANSIHAEGSFAGGVFGYNAMVNEAQIKTLSEEGGMVQKMLEAAKLEPQELAEAIFADAYAAPNGASLKIAQADGVQSQGQISGRLFVGGVIGYNAGGTPLTIQNYTSGSSVTADAAVSSRQMNEKYESENVYSYSGGITGYVTTNTALIECRVTGDVQTNGTYLGGLAEINEGMILGCAAAPVGNSGRNHVGGIVGINGVSGEMLNCSVGADVRGGSCVGGMTAENYGTVSINSALGEIASGRITASGNYAGAVAGINRAGAKITGIAVGEGVTVEGAGYVGGLVGQNEADAFLESQLVTENGEQMEAFCVSRADISASGVNAGGIAGGNAGTIRDAQFAGTLNARRKEDGGVPAAYGGIAGVNLAGGVIQNCMVGIYGSKTALTASGEAYLGGFAGKNAGSITAGDASSGETQLIAPEGEVSITSTGALATGGIVGYNEGELRNIATGRAWTVTAKDRTDEKGNVQRAAGPAGGVIGIQAEGPAVRNLTNYAGSREDGADGNNAQSKSGGVAGTVSAGGVIGAIQARRGILQIVNCVNYGPVTAQAKAGGVVGGCSFSGSKQKVEIQSCKNFGAVRGSAGAGIIVIAPEADASARAETAVAVTDCANTGDIFCEEGCAGAGIAALRTQDAKNITLQINKCRNYARPQEGQSEENFAGIFAAVRTEDEKTVLQKDHAGLAKEQVMIFNTLGVADVKYPIAAMDETKDAAQEYQRVSELYHSVNNYYYSCAEKEEPAALATAGVGSAVYYQSGAYRNLSETEAHADRSYLQARQKADGTVFNPNALPYKYDSYGNYERLETTLAEVCQELERNSKTEDDRPEAPQLEIQLADMQDGTPSYQIQVSNAASYDQEMCLLLNITASEALGASAAGTDPAAAVVALADLPYKLEGIDFSDDVYLYVEAQLAGAQQGGETLTSQKAEAALVLPGKKTLADVTVETAGTPGEGNTYTFALSGVRAGRYRAEVLNDLPAGAGSVIKEAAVSAAEAGIDGADGEITVDHYTEGCAARAYPIAFTSGTGSAAEIVLGYYAAQNVTFDELVKRQYLFAQEGGAEGTAGGSYTVADGYSVEPKSDGSYDVFCCPLLKSGGGTAVGLEELFHIAQIEEAADEPQRQEEPEQNADLLPPQSAELSWDWERTDGVDGEGNTLALSEDAFEHDIVITAKPAENAGGYLMRAAFYTQMADTDAGQEQYLLTQAPQYNGQMPLAMNRNTYTLSDLPFCYAGSYLCAQFCTVSADGAGASEWSEPMWFRMPKVCLDARALSLGSSSGEYAMTVLDQDGILCDLQTVALNHPALIWEQNPQTGGQDAGYRIELYDLLDAETKTDSAAYKEPWLTINLLRSPQGGGYCLERELTEKEQEIWRRENPGVETPKFLHVTVPLEKVARETEFFKEEYKKNQKLQNIYTVTMDELALGTDRYTSTYEQNVSGLGTYLIENVCVQLQIFEYQEEVTRYKLILPDVEQSAFLCDYTDLFQTHSVTVQPLIQSVFAEQAQGVEARRMQWTYLIRRQSMGQSGKEELLPVFRSLAADDAFDEEYDFEKEPVKAVQNKEDYLLLPRNYGAQISRRTGDAQRLAQQMSEQEQLGEEGAYGNPDGVIFEEENGGEIGTEPAVLPGDTVYDTEPGVSDAIQTEAQTEPQTVQTETQAEPQTEAQTAPLTQEQTETQNASAPEPQGNPPQTAGAVQAAVGLGVLEGRSAL